MMYSKKQFVVIFLFVIAITGLATYFYKKEKVNFWSDLMQAFESQAGDQSIVVEPVVAESPVYNQQDGLLNPIKGSLQPSIYGPENIIFVYRTDGEKVYFNNKEILGADLATFVPIENGRYIHSYAKDKNSVYYEGTKIEGADLTSFEILWGTTPEGCRDSTYSKDKNNVYFKNILVVGADPKNFEPTTIGPVKGSMDRNHGQYGKDQNNVFKESKVLDGVLPKDFETECEYG